MTVTYIQQHAELVPKRGKGTATMPGEKRRKGGEKGTELFFIPTVIYGRLRLSLTKSNTEMKSKDS